MLDAAGIGEYHSSPTLSLSIYISVCDLTAGEKHTQMM